MFRIPTHRCPTHPGEMLSEEFLKPLGISQRALADATRIPYRRINEIIHAKRSITPGTALRLAKVLDVSPDLWMNLQLRWDLYFARQHEESTLKTLSPLTKSEKRFGDSISSHV